MDDWFQEGEGRYPACRSEATDVGLLSLSISGSPTKPSCGTGCQAPNVSL
jgi:hypothetical protein